MRSFVRCQKTWPIFLPGYFAWRKFVNVTPDPVFTGLNGTNERMLGAMEVLGCVLVL
jgi:hypothetical protein